MSQDIQLTYQRLDELWESPEVLTLDTAGKKYVLFSDLHLGNGGEADDFYRNQPALITALAYYLAEGYALILLGDIEEFWQFDLADTLKTYGNTVYSRIQSFGDQRVYRVFGNHDREWGGLRDPIRNNPILMVPGMEAIKLRDMAGKVRFLLVHGHQGSLDSDKYAWFSKFFVRLYGGIEPILKYTGLFRAGSATKSSIARNYERILYTWARQKRAILICGHSHRAIFASRTFAEQLEDEIAERMTRAQGDLTPAARTRLLREIEQREAELADERQKGREIEPLEDSSRPRPNYFNTGCGLYTDGITAIEITGDEIRLVKWNAKWSKVVRSGQPRQVFKEGKISKFIKEIDAPGVE